MSSSTPTTPTRPARSIHRLTIHSVSSASTTSLPIENTPTSSNTLSPETLKIAPLSYKSQNPHRKSISSVRRKPVPLSTEDLSLEMEDLQSDPHQRTGRGRGDTLHVGVGGNTPTTGQSEIEPPMYILQVDPLPLPSPPTSFDSHRGETSEGGLPPSYPTPSDIRSLEPSQSNFEDLPTYTVETRTEPKTLAKGLWKWGFVCPPLWFVGMCIMWIPLNPLEEETDPEKAQKIQEMIAILRVTELKYARRCATAFAAFTALVILIVVIAVVVSLKV